MEDDLKVGVNWLCLLISKRKKIKSNNMFSLMLDYKYN